MTFVLAVFVFPLLLAVLSFAVGLLVERAAGWQMPAVLLAPLGFGGIVCVTQLTTWKGAIAPATPWIVVALAIVGVVVTRRSIATRWSERRSGWWWGWLPAPAAYLIAAAPIILAGRVTFPGYLLDTTGAIQLIGTQRIITHGQSFNVAGSGYANQLHDYFGTGYPSGGHSALAGVGHLVGVDYLWLQTPFQAAMLGLSAFVLFWIARRVGLPRPAAAVAGLVAAVPALVYAYVLQGSIKEIALLPSLLLLGAFVLLARELLSRGPRAAIPLGVVGAAGWASIGLAFTPWLALGALAILIVGYPAIRVVGQVGDQARMLAPRIGVFAAALIVLALPTVAKLHTALTQATSVSDSNSAAVADPGNLLRPLLKVQAFGVWLGYSHRTDPEHLRETYLLIGVVMVGVLLGLVWLWRRRQLSALAFIAVMALTWLGLTSRSTTWTSAKLLVLVSPVVVLTAMIGAFGRLGPRRLEALVLAAVIAGGVLGSDALLYHSTTLAPTARMNELRSIGMRDVSQQTPTLIPDFDEYALYLLRDGKPDGPGQARHQVPFTTADGGPVGYGQTYDLDDLPVDQVDSFGTIVVRRSAFKSRPPAAFSLVRRGRYYDVWRKRPGASAPRVHLGVGTPTQPAVTPTCRRVAGLARTARRDGVSDLTVAERAPNVVGDLTTAQHSTLAIPQPGGEIAFGGPGSITMRVNVRAAGTYRLWLDGEVGRPLTATVDGRPIGSVSDQYGGSGNAMQLGTLPLTAGTHVLVISRGGGGLEPGDASGTTMDAAALEPIGAETEPVTTVPVADWRSLCQRPVDWIEVQ